MTTPSYAAIYARVSTEDQGKGFSIPTQIEACQKLAEHDRYTVSESHVLIDGGISGTTMDRPALRRLRELVTTQAITAAIVYDPDRLSRNLGHQLLLPEEFERAGVTLLIVSHPLEQGPEGWLFFQMRGALAEYERAKILERTKRGRAGRAQAGHVWGGQVPLGYRAIREPHKAHWEIDDAEAVIVRRIFAMCLAGMSTYIITRQLSDERIPTRGNGRRVVKPGVWRASSVHRILSNEAYMGQTYFNKYVRTGKTTRRLRPREEWQAIAVPAIIDQATFDAAQRQLDRNRDLSPRNQKREYLLSGRRLLCGRCGRVMVGGAYPSAHGMTRRYRCSSLSHIMDPEGRCYGQLKADDQRAKVDHELGTLDAALTTCDREAQRWAEAYAAEVIDIRELKGYRAEIDAKRQSLLAQQAACQARLEAISQEVAQVGHSSTTVHGCASAYRRLMRPRSAWPSRRSISG